MTAFLLVTYHFHERGYHPIRNWKSQIDRATKVNPRRCPTCAAKAVTIHENRDARREGEIVHDSENVNPSDILVETGPIGGILFEEDRHLMSYQGHDDDF